MMFEHVLDKAIYLNRIKSIRLLKFKREESLYEQCKEKVKYLIGLKGAKKKTKDDRKHLKLLQDYMALYENK